MNELELYVDSLDPSLSNEEKVRLVQEWKKANRWKEQEVEVSEEVELEEIDLGTVKKKDGAPGAVAPSVEPKTAPIEDTDFTLEDTFSVSPKPEITYNIDGKEVSKEEFDSYSKKKEKEKEVAEMSFIDKLKVDLEKGSTTLGEMIASVPETIYDIFALPQNLLAKATGLDIEASSKKFKEDLGIENPILEYYKAESEKLQEVQDIYNNENYEYQGIYKNFSEGNYADGFKQLASGITESAPVSISMMIGGATTGVGRLTAGSTIAFAGPEIEEQREKSPEQAEFNTIIKGLGLGAAESVFSSIGKGTIGRVYKDIILKEGKEQGVKIFRKGLVDMYRSVLTKFGAPASMVGEGVEEVATTITQNMINGIDPFSNVADSFIQGVGGGLTYGAPINAVKAKSIIKEGYTNLQIKKELSGTDIPDVSKAFSDEKPTSEAEIKISQIPGSIEILDKKVQKQIENNEITKDQGDNIKNRAREVQGAVNQLKPLDVNVKNQPALVDLMIEQKNLKNTIKQVNNSSLTKAESARLTEIDTELGDLITKDKAEKIDVGAKKIAEQIGVGFESFDTQEDVDSAIATLQEEGGKIDAKNSDNYGTFITLPGDKSVIILNKETATEDRMFTEGQHETGHAVIYETVKNNPKAAIALGQSLLNEIRTNKDINIKPSFQARLDQYIQDADISQADTMEEVMTLVSDGLTDGTIEINETIGVKLGNFIRRALSAMGMKVKFKNGKDVLNFIKDYNRSVHRQKGLSRGLKKTAIEGAEVTITPDTITETEIKESVAKESKRVYQKVESMKEDLVNPKTKMTTAFMIANDPSMINEIDRRLKFEADEATREDVIRNFLFDDKRGLVGLLQGYDPSKNDSIMGYLNSSTPGGKLLDIRLFEFFKDDPRYERVIQSETQEGITEKMQRQTAETQETTLEAKEKPITKKPTETTKFEKARLTPEFLESITIEKGQTQKDAIENKITEVIKDSYKDKGPIEKYKDLGKTPKALAQLYADMFGLKTVDALIEKARNIPKFDNEALVKMRQFLVDNAASDFARLPKGKDAMGKATGILQTTIGKALYNNEGKLTGTLKNYLDIIKGKNVTINGIEFNKIVDGKQLPLYRDAQHYKAAIQSHINNRALETLVESPGERAKLGAKFSKRISTVLQASDIPGPQGDFTKFDFDWNKTLNNLLKDTGVSPIDMSTESGRKRFLDYAVNSGLTKKLPPKFWEALAFTTQNAIPKGTLKEIKLIDPEFGSFLKALNEETKDEFPFRAGREYAANLPFKNVQEAKDWIKKTGIENFAKDSKEFDAMLSSENVYGKKFDLPSKLSNKDFISKQNDSINGLKKVFEIFQNEIMRDTNGNLNPEGIAFVGTLLSSSSYGQGHFLRSAAPIRFFEKGYLEAGRSKATMEHTLPAAIVGKYLFIQSLQGNLSENFNNVKDNYFQGPLLNVSDDKLQGKGIGGIKFSYKAKTPDGWLMTDNIWARYFNINVASIKGGINPANIMFNKKESVFDKFNITPSGLTVNNETKNQMPKVEALNASSQPVALTDPQASTQQQVYNQGVLDNALNEGRKLDTPVKKFEVKQETLNELGLSTPQQIAIYVAEKASKGFNSFTFDKASLGGSKAVKDILNQIDIKSKVQVAKASKRKTFDTVINDMIESSSGIESYKKFSAAKARTIGRDKGRFDFMTLASSAEDFKGLLYRLIGDGKQGEAQFEFLKNNLIDPYNRAEDAIVQAKISAANDFMALKEQFKGLPKTLETETGVGKFTYQHALRTYMWTQQGMSIPGLSKADARKLNKFITDDAQLKDFADQLISIQKGKPYPEPGKDWLGGNLTTDIIGGINKVNRAEYQQEWRENVEIIFSPENLNKMEAAYGTRWRKALENTLKRMKAGTNRLGYNDATSNILDWVNNSVGAVMFLNTRSALLQTISAVNFINWGDNNIIKAGQAFANQKQYWSDFMTLMNSDYLTQRRKGLKINVSESEIADAVKDSKNKVKAAIAYLLSKGFVFTRYADSFAIASGGATFYRNRIKKYLKEGMSQELAQEKAFNDFRDIAEESQQSSSPDKISMQQASAAGRVILNWANTPMQYVRIQKRALQDLIAGRGDAKVHISRIAYYGVMQNLIFNALQQALFAIGFGDDDEKDEKKKKAKDKKIARVANGMIDSQLKGLGIAGAAMVATKNTLMKIYEESEKKTPEFEKGAIEALSFSPAISSKYRKIVGGLKSFSWNRKEMKEKGFSLDNPAYLAGAQIITAVTNIPIDRVIKKANNIRGIMSEQSQMWQKVSMALGYSAYDVGLPYYGGWDKPKEPTEAERKQQEIDVMKRDTNTAEQTQMLLDLGLTKKQIKALRYEDNRVKKIIELQNKKKDAESQK